MEKKIQATKEFLIKKLYSVFNAYKCLTMFKLHIQEINEATIKTKLVVQFVLSRCTSNNTS